MSWAVTIVPTYTPRVGQPGSRPMLWADTTSGLGPSELYSAGLFSRRRRRRPMMKQIMPPTLAKRTITVPGAE